MDQLVVNNIDDAQKLILDLEDKFSSVGIEGEKVNFFKEANYAIQAIQRNDYLLTMARRDPTSLKDAVTNVAAIGLTLNPAEKHSYLVPMDGSVQLFISYIGYLVLATKTNAITYAHVELVYEKDTFEMIGVTQEPIHKRDSFATDRGKIVGGYCCAKLPSNDFMTVTMTSDELNKIRNASKSKNGPWKNWPEEMMKKSIVKRAAKMWPSAKDARLTEAIQISNEFEGIDFEKQERILAETEKKRREEVSKEAEFVINEKPLLIADIKERSGVLTEGNTQEQKREFLEKRLKVMNFSDLNRKNNDELRVILSNLGE